MLATSIRWYRIDEIKEKATNYTVWSLVMVREPVASARGQVWRFSHGKSPSCIFVSSVHASEYIFEFSHASNWKPNDCIVSYYQKIYQLLCNTDVSAESVKLARVISMNLIDTTGHVTFELYVRHYRELKRSCTLWNYTIISIWNDR